MSPQSSSAILNRLPPELLAAVLSHLRNRDLKNLRLTCRGLCGRAPLRLYRIFLSANPLNISVFRAVADHATLRLGVLEVVWDDAVLIDWGEHPRGFVSYVDLANLEEGPSSSGPARPLRGYPYGFKSAYEFNIRLMGALHGEDADRPDIVEARRQMNAQMPPDESWRHYQQLLVQQRAVLESAADAEALRYGLRRFPALRTLRVTPAAHGVLFFPLYETPMIRAFPYGFNYPIPRGWPTFAATQPSRRSRSWDNEKVRDMWRGFCIVMRELAAVGTIPGHHSVSELIIDANYLDTGLNCRVFERPCPEYDDLVTLLRRPGFRRLDLDLLAQEQPRESWQAYRSTYLRKALGEARGLRHVSLRNEINFMSIRQHMRHGTQEQAAMNIIPLRTILPVERWCRLEHFGLSKFMVRQDDLMSLLAALPRSLRSVELSFLEFFGGSGSWRDLLDEMRGSLKWRNRPPRERPRVALRCGGRAVGLLPHRFVVVDDAVNGFLYGDETNPFTGHTDGNLPDDGRGVEQDPFMPAYSRPHVRPARRI